MILRSARRRTPQPAPLLTRSNLVLAAVSTVAGALVVALVIAPLVGGVAVAAVAYLTGTIDGVTRRRAGRVIGGIAELRAPRRYSADRAAAAAAAGTDTPDNAPAVTAPTGAES